MLKEKALDEPMCGLPRRLNSTRSIALASVAVPTVERGVGAHSLLVDDDRGRQPFQHVDFGPGQRRHESLHETRCRSSLISRCDSAAMVPNTSDDLPDPETPVNTVSRRLGISTLTSFRLFSRAPWTRIRSWLSAECWLEEAMVAIVPSSSDGL